MTEEIQQLVCVLSQLDITILKDDKGEYFYEYEIKMYND